MSGVLAYAESGDPNAMNLPMILGGAAIVVVIAVMTFILLAVARSREHRQREFIFVVAIFWALISIGSLFYAGDTQINWSNEQTLRLQTGYGNPQDTTGAPALPWAIWTGLAAAYAAMLIWSISQKQVEQK
jgi:heme/copper-type cytochrome/quinol oxidase subunit 1